jgi:hypothetical protein
MALSQAERIQLSSEALDLPLKAQAAQDTQVQIAQVKAGLQDEDNSLKIFFDKFNDIANAYQNEERWLNGTTYATVTNADVDAGARRAPGNKFFPDGWIQFPPVKDDSTVGLPTSTSAGHEAEATADLNAAIDLLVNGQTSSVPDDDTTTPYPGGTVTLTMTTGGQTLGNYLILDDGSNSALVIVTDNSASPSIEVSEVIAPLAPLSGTIDVIENFSGWTNSERNTLTSSNYENVLQNLAADVETEVANWKTPVENQRTELQANGDTRSPQATEITDAIADADNAINIIEAWELLPDTGVSGTDSKYTDNNISTLQTEVSDRLTFASTRDTQITTALGSFTQAGDGSVSGSGVYYDRFIQIDSRINLAGGPLTEFYEKDTADQALTQIANNVTQRLATFDTELTVTALTADGTDTQDIEVDDVTGFAISDSVFVMADGQTELTGTITNISGTTVTLDFTVSADYTVAARARLYKQL